MQDLFNQIIEQELEQDVKSGDVTSLLCIKENSVSKANLSARQDLIISGLDFSVEFLRQKKIKISINFKDGGFVKKGSILATMEGSTLDILKYERTILNIIQLMSAVATSTKQYVDKVSHTNAKVLDTRKTITGLRHLQKYAVKCGGGNNHRIGLYDAVMIKDNHVTACGGIKQAIEKCLSVELPIIVECDTVEQVKQAVNYKVDKILADNMDLKQLAEVVNLAKKVTQGRIKIEASGGVNLSTVKNIAETGVDFISIGALTHTIDNIDIGLDFKNSHN